MTKEEKYRGYVLERISIGQWNVRDIDDNIIEGTWSRRLAKRIVDRILNK